MDETIEEDVIEEVKEEIIEEPIRAEGIIPNANAQQKQGVSFNNIDYVKTENGVEQINAPKTLNRLEEISSFRNEQRKQENDDDDNENIKLKITDQPFSIDNFDIHNIDEPKIDLLPDLLIDDIEILE
jgi:hypothetical protein